MVGAGRLGKEKSVVRGRVVASLHRRDQCSYVTVPNARKGYFNFGMNYGEFFFWEGHEGSKINRLVKWNLVTESQNDGGLKAKNAASIAKWGWSYFNEDSSLWSKLLGVFMVKTLLIGTLLVRLILVYAVLGLTSQEYG